MAIASGVDKQLLYKAQTGLDNPVGGATGSGGQILRRTSSALELKKATFQSNEIRTDFQVADFRHGSKFIEGPISGELSPGTYKDFMGSALRRAFAAVSTISTLTLTVATGTPNTVGRATGSWLTDGVKVGDVIRLTGGLNAANINKNLVVVDIPSALNLSVITLDGSAMATNGTGIASCTCTFPGKKTFVPVTGHTTTYYTIEHWYSNISLSQAFIDCKVNTMDINISATGMATASFGFLGRNMAISASQRFNTGQVAATTSGVLAGANGALIVGGSSVGVVTGMQFTINGGMTKEDVVGANMTPDVFNGSVVGSGQMTILLENDTYMQMFEDETDALVTMALTTGSSATSDFISFTMPRIKVGGNSTDDGQKGIVQTVPFQILLQGSGGTGTKWDQTTISIQDSLA